MTKREANISYQYQSLLEPIERGFPEGKELLPLHVINTLVFKGGCVLILKNIRTELIQLLHIGHQGVNSIKNNAR